MNTATRATTARKAMRVATVFTGAAAAAVGFAPGALAAPGHAAAQGNAAQANGKAQALAPASGTQSRGCGTDHWLHIQYYNPFHSVCREFGFVGIKGFNAMMEGECGGNNVGRIYDNPNLPITFRQGSTYRAFNEVSISAVAISRYSGTQTCAWPH